MQLLHEQELTGPRNETIEREQEQQERETSTEEENTTDGEDDDDDDNDDDDDDDDAEKNVVDTSADMFSSCILEPIDEEIIQSVLQDLEEEEEDSYYPSSLSR